MFKKNVRHLQIPLTSHVDELPETLRKRLHNSWAETFYQEFFIRLDEKPFEVLYVDFPSRPNVPVNVLVGLEFLKAANGWTDEELYDNACYDIQVRYALGYRQLGEGYFDLRTLYYFRERLAQHMQETGENLLEQAFEGVTDQQLSAFALKTGKQRTDSTQLASNIRQMGRVQLLVTVLQRVYRMLSAHDQQRYTELFAPYLKGHAGHYVYRLKAEELPAHLQQIGADMQRLLAELEKTYSQETTYQVLARVFSEHFRQEKEALHVKAGSELSANSLQSADDLEATYREKRGQGYRGYVANLTETCDPENPVQLITKVQVAPNTTDDSALLAEAVPEIKERMAVDTVFADGGYGSPQADAVLQEHNVTLIQTAIRGRSRDPQRLYLDDFEVKSDPQGSPQQVICPAGKQAAVTLLEGEATFQADFPLSDCQACPLRQRCPLTERKRSGTMRLRFTTEEWRRAKRLRQSRLHHTEAGNLRSAVEATVRSLKHPFPAGKLPVRGRFRVTCMVIGAAAVSNVRRLHRYLQASSQGEQAKKGAQAKQNRLQERAGEAVFSFFCFLRQTFRTFGQLRRLGFGW